MSLNFPNRFGWFLIGLVIIFLMQGACVPIQAPADAQPAAASDETSEAGSDVAARANLSTNISNEINSPNSKWRATSLFQVPRGSDEYYQELVVTHADGSPSYTLVDGWFPMGLGYTVATPFTWSQDGERFYYTNRPNPDGCGLFVNGSDLYQVDLATGEPNEILPPHTTMWLALSPDEQHVAYNTVGEPTLLIHSLSSDEPVPFDLTPILGDGQAGAIVWSPDSSTFAFAIAHQPCIGGWAEATSLYLLDAESLTLTPLLEQDDRLLIPVAWPSDGILLLENQVPYDQIEQTRQFTLDLATNSITPMDISATDTSPITATTTISQ